MVATCRVAMDTSFALTINPFSVPPTLGHQPSSSSTVDEVNLLIFSTIFALQLNLSAAEML